MAANNHKPETAKPVEVHDASEVMDAKERAKPKFRVVKAVTLPLLKIVPERTYYLKITAPIEQAKEIKGARKPSGEAATMAPPMIAKVMDMETGELAIIIVPAVLNTELHDQYPDDSYVGLIFGIVKHEKATGKRYATFSIAQVEAE